MAFNSFTKFLWNKDVQEESPSTTSSLFDMSAKLSRKRSQSDASSTCSENGFSTTDGGDDIPETFVDFDDFASASSDEDNTTECKITSPRTQEAAATCVYSVLMLLHLRAAVCGETQDDDTLGYGARSIAELPARFNAKSKSEIASGKTGKAVQSSDNDDDGLLRAMRSILNKLTVEKFDALFEQLAACGISRSAHVSLLMQEIFEKATIQHHFIPMYADLCVKLEKDARIATVVEKAELPNNFRRLLLNECQNVFEQLLEATGDASTMDEEVLLRQKQRALGNMKLIGQLLVHGMLSSDVFIGCCERLLQHRTDCPAALESLVALMMVAGHKFDLRTAQHFQKLEDIFDTMRKLTKDKSVQPRNRFLIRDVLDAREAGWPSKSRAGSTPTKLEEVRNCVEIVPGKRGVSLDFKPSCAVDMAKHKSDAEAQKIPSNRKSVTFSPEVSTATSNSASAAFDVVAWRRALATIFDRLASDKNIPAAVQLVREQKVPLDKQAEQFVDILTRVVEERRGAVRRCELAFLAGLAAAEDSAFDRRKCLEGIGVFFAEVYTDLQNEVHRLPAIMKSEFMPTMLAVLPSDDLYAVVPSSMRK